MMGYHLMHVHEIYITLTVILDHQHEQLSHLCTLFLLIISYFAGIMQITSTNNPYYF